MNVCSKLESVPGKPLQPGLVFAGMAGAYQSEDVPLRVLSTFLNYGCKQFYNIGHILSFTNTVAAVADR